MATRAEKVAVFIDGNYLNMRLADHGFYKEDLDLRLFSDLLCDGSYRFRTYYYDGKPHEDFSSKYEIEDYQKSLTTLPRFMVKLGRVLKNEGRYRQKGVDVLLAIDLTEMSVSRRVDRVVLVLSDTDYIPAIKKARENFTLVTLYSFYEPHFSHIFKEECDDCMEITDELILKARRQQHALMWKATG